MIPHTQLEIGEALIEIVLQDVIAYRVAVLMLPIVCTMLLQAVVSKMHIVVIIVQLIVI